MTITTKRNIAGLALLGALAAAPMTGMAQTATGTATGTAAGTTTQRSGGDRPTAPVPGANSFTEGQARDRIQDTGFANVTDLRKDDQGVWRGRATRNGSPTEVSLDYQGNIFAGGTLVDPSAGTGGATPANNPGTGTAGTGATGTSATTGTGMTTGTGTTMGTGATGTIGGATGAAAGAATGAGRTMDRALGTNATGTNPAANAPDGTPGNPPGTAAGRAVDRALGTNSTGANPSGNTGTTGAPSR